MNALFAACSADSAAAAESLKTHRTARALIAAVPDASTAVLWRLLRQRFYQLTPAVARVRCHLDGQASVVFDAHGSVPALAAAANSLHWTTAYFSRGPPEAPDGFETGCGKYARVLRRLRRRKTPVVAVCAQVHPRSGERGVRLP